MKNLLISMVLILSVANHVLGLTVLELEQVSSIARKYITKFNRQSAYLNNGLEGETQVIPFSISCGTEKFVLLGCQDDISDIETDWHIVRLKSDGELEYVNILTNEVDLLYSIKEVFVLSRKNGTRSLFFSRNDLPDVMTNIATTCHIFNVDQNELSVQTLNDGGLSLFRSPDFISVEVCDPWILKGTNAVVEQAANIPPLTSRVIACSDKAGAAALYRACRSQTGTNVVGSVSAVFFDVNRDGDCDAYLTDETRATDEGKFEWSLALHGTNGWMMAEADFVSDVELATGEHLALTAGGRPYTSPKTLVAATNDFFAVSKWMWWHSDEYLEIGAPEIEVSNPRELNKLEKLPCEVIE